MSGGAGADRSDCAMGCLLGSALGDALGAPIEFLDLASIRAVFGRHGIEDLAPAYGRIGAITDDTQMTLFTAEGLLRALVRQQERGMCHVPSVVHYAYLRWLLTQGATSKVKIGTDGWLFANTGLHRQRAPGYTCLGALRQATGFGMPSTARNDSKGCGGVMRVAPVGLFTPLIGRPDEIFDLAAADGCPHPRACYGIPCRGAFRGDDRNAGRGREPRDGDRGGEPYAARA